MITKLILENFQGVSSRQEVAFDKYTLILGENSAGKSSIARALLLLAQSLQESVFVKGQIKPHFFTFTGNLIDLAGFRNVSHLHSGVPIKVGLTVSVDREGTFAENSIEEFQSVSFEVEEDDSGLISFLLGFYFVLEGYPEEVTLEFRSIGNWSMKLEKIQVSSQAAEEKFFRGTRDEVSSLYDLNFIFRSWLRTPAGITIRSNPERMLDYWLNFAKQNFTRNLYGLAHVPALREIGSRIQIKSPSPIDRRRRKRSKTTVEQNVSNFLNRLTQGRYNFEKTSFGANEKISFLGDVEVSLLRDNSLGTQVTFQDVGVGMSQILPILEGMVSLEADGEGTLLVEQPELHLHPRLQADLSESFYRLGGTIQVIAETHSEAMLLRLQRIARSSDSAAAVFPGVCVMYARLDGDRGTVFESFELRSEFDYLVDLPNSFSELRLQELED